MSAFLKQFSVCHKWIGLIALLSVVKGHAEFAVIHSFVHPIDGGFVYAAPVADASGTKLIGVTNTGVQGVGATGLDQGTVYSINLDGSGYQILHNFSGVVPDHDGAYPLYGHLVRSGDTIYSMTSTGGNGAGTIYKINTDGTNYSILKNFNPVGTGGFVPYSTTLTPVGSTLYGMTTTSSAELFGNQSGVVFSMGIDGTGYTPLHTFPYSNTQNENFNPYGSVVVAGSTILGTTSSGGANQNGVIFKMDIDGSNYSVVHDFGSLSSADGFKSLGTLTLAGSKVYGMTQGSGLGLGSGGGTIFSLNTDGTGYTVMHTFTGSASDGMNPNYGGDLTLSGNKLYGATSYGGTYGQGAIFEIGTDGTGFNTLYSFGSGGGSQGKNPFSSPILIDGKFYGTTPGNAGGVGNNAAPGTLYMFDPSSFTHTDNFANTASFSGFNTSFTGGHDTVLELLGGTAVGPTTVTASLVSVPAVTAALASDVIDLVGTGASNPFVLQLNYDPDLANTLYGPGVNPFLGWLDPNDNTWKNAVLGNVGGTPTFVNGAYNPATDFQLGYYGIDPINHEVWAVVNHNSEFAVFGPEPAPEPSRALLLLSGVCVLFLRRRR